MPKLEVIVVYYSAYGSTKLVAEAIGQGIEKINNVISTLVRISNDGSILEENWQKLENAQAIIFGAPTYMGSLPGAVKTFMDSTSKIWLNQKWKNKITGGFTHSGGLSGDKLLSIIQLFIFAEQHGMIWVGNDIMTENSKTLGFLNRLTSFSGLMTQSNSSDKTLEIGDINTAILYGKRIASITMKFVKNNIS